MNKDMHKKYRVVCHDGTERAPYFVTGSLTFDKAIKKRDQWKRNNPGYNYQLECEKRVGLEAQE